MDEKGRWLLEEPDFSRILNTNHENSYISYLVNIYKMNKTNNNELNNIYLLKNLFHFRLHDEVIVEKNFEIKRYVFAIRIFDRKTFLENYDTEAAILYLTDQHDNFMIKFVICFVTDMLRMRTKFFYMGWRKFLTIPMITTISKKLLNAYFQYKIKL